MKQRPKGYSDIEADLASEMKPSVYTALASHAVFQAATVSAPAPAKYPGYPGYADFEAAFASEMKPSVSTALASHAVFQAATVSAPAPAKYHGYSDFARLANQNSGVGPSPSH